MIYRCKPVASDGPRWTCVHQRVEPQQWPVLSNFLFKLEFGPGQVVGFPAPTKFRWQIPNWELVLIDDLWQLYRRERERETEKSAYCRFGKSNLAARY